MTNEKMSKAAAYDKARKEFYQCRHLEDVERRIAKEEARSTGAYFGKSAMEVGMELENKAWEDWKAWAQKEITQARQTAASSYTGPVNEEVESAVESADEPAEIEEASEAEAPAR
jgi:small subunit ribosomal protein S23